MSASDESIDTSYGREVGNLVESVRAVGERARFLAVNLAVIAAKLKQEGASSTRLNEDILDLVARITRVSQDVNDAVSAMENGIPRTDLSSQRLPKGCDESGIPDERVLASLEASLRETLELSRHIFRWIKELKPTVGNDRPRRQMPPQSRSS